MTTGAPHGGLSDYQREAFSARIESYEAEQPGYAAMFSALENKLIEVGGHALVPHLEANRQMVALSEEGAFCPGASRLELGEPSACHSNSAGLWAQGKVDAIVTGFALSNDGLWREHSWGRQGDTTVETTDGRLAYYGVALTGRAALGFAASEFGNDEYWCNQIFLHHRALVEKEIELLGPQEADPGSAS